MRSCAQLLNLLASRIPRGPHRLIRFVDIAVIAIDSSDANTANLNMGELQLNRLVRSSRSRASQVPGGDYQRSIRSPGGKNIIRGNREAFVAQPMQQFEYVKSWLGNAVFGD